MEKKISISKLKKNSVFNTQNRSQNTLPTHTSTTHMETLLVNLLFTMTYFQPALTPCSQFTFKGPFFQCNFHSHAPLNCPKHPHIFKFQNLKTVGHHPHIYPYSRVSDPFLHPHLARPQVAEKKNFNLKTEFKICLQHPK